MHLLKLSADFKFPYNRQLMKVPELEVEAYYISIEKSHL